MHRYYDNISNKKIYNFNQVPSPKFKKKFIIYNACYLREVTQNNGKSKSQILKAYQVLYIYNCIEAQQKLILVQHDYVKTCDGNW